MAQSLEHDVHENYDPGRRAAIRNIFAAVGAVALSGCNPFGGDSSGSSASSANPNPAPTAHDASNVLDTIDLSQPYDFSGYTINPDTRDDLDVEIGRMLADSIAGPNGMEQALNHAVPNLKVRKQGTTDPYQNFGDNVAALLEDPDFASGQIWEDTNGKFHTVRVVEGNPLDGIRVVEPGTKNQDVLVDMIDNTQQRYQEVSVVSTVASTFQDNTGNPVHGSISHQGTVTIEFEVESAGYLGKTVKDTYKKEIDLAELSYATTAAGADPIKRDQGNTTGDQNWRAVASEFLNSVLYENEAKAQKRNKRAMQGELAQFESDYTADPSTANRVRTMNGNSFEFIKAADGTTYAASPIMQNAVHSGLFNVADQQGTHSIKMKITGNDALNGNQTVYTHDFKVNFQAETINQQGVQSQASPANRGRRGVAMQMINPAPYQSN